MSYQDPSQSPFGPPQQQPQQPGQSGWGQQSQPGTWGQPGAPSPEQQGWGSQQSQIPQQPNYPNAPGYGQPGQPQDYMPQQPQQFNQQPDYGQGQGYPGGPQGYMPQTDFGSGGYGPGYPAPNQGNSTLATVSLWLGIFFGWGIVNLIISILAIKETGPGKKQGRNKAITGLILTLVWAVIWIGVTFSVTGHAKSDVTSLTAAPTAASTAGATATGTVGEQANSSSSDPGCQAAQTAFNTYSKNAVSGGLSAIQTLARSLASAADQSQVASNQLKTVGGDFLELSDATTPPNLVSDMTALDTACGMAFTFSG